MFFWHFIWCTQISFISFTTSFITCLSILRCVRLRSEAYVGDKCCMLCRTWFPTLTGYPCGPTPHIDAEAEPLLWHYGHLFVFRFWFDVSLCYIVLLSAFMNCCLRYLSPTLSSCSGLMRIPIIHLSFAILSFLFHCCFIPVASFLSSSLSPWLPYSACSFSVVLFTFLFCVVTSYTIKLQM